MKATTPVIAGYLPEYRIAGIDAAVAERLTDVIFFSLEPTEAGGLNAARFTPEAAKKLAAMKKRNRKLRVLVTVGGWGRAKAFAAMTADDKLRAAFVRAATGFCRSNGLDGLDLDWEHPSNQAEEKSYARLMTDLKQAFKPHRFLLTAAMAGWQNLPKPGFAALDRVHVMAYDHPGDAGGHSTLAKAQKDVQSFLARGVSPKAVCLGVPFYGRHRADADRALAYVQIVQKHRPAPGVDEVDGFAFNGVETIKAKARYSREKGLAGIMIWEIGQDAAGKASLLRAVADGLKG